MIHLLASFVLLQTAQAAPGLPVAGKTYDLTKPGRFDVLTYDSKYHRVLAAHSEGNSLAVLDTETGKTEEIETGAINGVAVSGKLNRIFVGGPNKKLTALDRETLKILGSVDLTGPADVIAVDSKRGQVYVGHDDGSELWVIDGMTLKLVGTVAIEEAPEFVEYDSRTDKVYQNIKSSDHLQVIDPETRKVVASWPTAPMTSPHGLVLDKKGGKAYAAGRNGKLIEFELATGKQLSVTETGTGADQIALDTSLMRLYWPGGDKLTVVDLTGAAPKVIGTVPLPKGVHTLAVDSKSHDVWVAYGDTKSAHLAQFVTK